MLAVYKKELRSYFIGPIGYIYVALFLLVSSLLFTYTTLYAGTCSVTTYYTFILYLFAILIPLLTMRMLSEEKKTRTEQILLTAPVSLTGVILAKFLAAFTLFAGTLLVSCLNFIILYFYGTPNTAIIISTTLGILLIGAAFVAIGIFVSACTENQLVAALVTIVAIASTLVLNVLHPSAGRYEMVLHFRPFLRLHLRVFRFRGPSVLYLGHRGLPLPHRARI